MTWTRRLVCLLCLPIIAPALHAQVSSGRVTGRVTDADLNVPIPNVDVTLSGSRLGTRTGADGRYTITGITPGKYTVDAKALGFAPGTQSVTVSAGGTVEATFALKRVATTLQQMVVIGYGSQRRSDLTGSVSTVTPHVEQTPITSVEQTLQGAAAGVQVTTASSAPGGGISIRIRGGSSISGNNEPLYVIDGFPVENDPNNSSPTDGGRDANVTVPANPLASLNPEDIASIEILKDASATSIYGSRGANGVVIITTKRGAGGKPRVTLDTYTGTQSIAKRYDLLNAQQFAQFANAWAQTQTTPTTPFPNVDSIGTGTNWQDQVFRSAPIGSLNLGVSGGTTNDNPTTYSLSGGVLQQQGIVRGSDFKRVSVRGTLDQSVGSRLKMGSNLLISRVNSDQVPTDGSFNSGAGAVGAALQYIPIMPVRQADGTYSLMSTNYPTVLSALGLTGGTIPNPVASANDVQDVLGDTRTLANANGEYTLLPGLSLRANIGADLSNRTRDTYYPRTTLQGQALNGRAIRGTLDNTSWLTEYTLNFNRQFSSQAIQAVAGYTRQTQTSIRESEGNSNFVSDITGFEDIGAGTQAGGPTVSSGKTRYTLASYLGRINYTLFDRYLFTVTGRQDGSSRFGANDKWGFFPSAAFGWKISSEPFMRRFTSIDELKFRASYGVAGNPSIQPYQSLTHLNATQYSFGGQIAAGYYPSTLGNADLTWESSKQTDLGLDLTMLHNAVDFTADYYNKRTDNLLLPISLPTESGFTSAYVNAGSIQNRGLELGLTLNIVRGDEKSGGLSWTTSFNYARNRNKVLGLGGVDRLFATSINSDIKASGSLVQVGQPMGVFYGYKTAGIFRDSASLNAWNAVTKMGSGSAPGLGSSRFVDVNGDSVINANDRTIIGDPNPKFTVGWQNTISFKGFQILGLFDGSHGGQIMNLNLYRLEGASPSGNIIASRYLDAWSPTNPNGKYTKIGSGIGFLGSDFTSELVESGSFFRLRTLSISHSIPSQLLRSNSTTARVYVTGENLHTWTKYDGFNPDVSSLGVGNLNRGVDIGSYPLARTFIFGINLSY
jgi:TonB-dependent starch-binding outer membrane protein SusC